VNNKGVSCQEFLPLFASLRLADSSIVIIAVIKC